MLVREWDVRLHRTTQPEDSQNEVACMPNTAKLVIIDSVWGHLGEYMRKTMLSYDLDIRSMMQRVEGPML